jgi:trans-aconitate methyltransferase
MTGEKHPLPSRGPPQSWSAESYDQNARFVSDLGAEILSWLEPRPGERILDLGCGDGVLTLKLMEAGASVVGVDTSPSLLASARARGVDAREIDGEKLAFAGEFDAVFSNAALHWMTRAEDVVAGVARALKEGGRFVAEFGGHGNVAAIVTALRAVAKTRGLDPALSAGWFYPTPDEYRALLARHGLEVERILLAPRPTPLPTGMRGWLMTFRRPYFEAMPEAAREEVLDELEALLAPALRDRAGNWTADYVRLRVRAHKP